MADEMSFNGVGEVGEDVAGLLAAVSTTVSIVSMKRLPAVLCVPKESLRQMIA